MGTLLLQMGSGMGFGWGMWLFGVLAMLLVVAGIVALVLWAGGSGTSDAGSDDAMEELRARYARGELSDQEFEERASRLRESK
jgi:putative membrane protein